MQTFPPSSDLSHLIGGTLQQVRLDAHSCQFVFERSRILAILAVEHVEPDGRLWRYANIADEAGPSLLHRLVGRAVRSLRSEGLVLTISFDDDAQLRIFSDLEPYEAGVIDGDGGLIAF